MSEPTKPTAIVPHTPTSCLQRPADGSVEAAAFRQAAEDMTAVLTASENSPGAIVLWNGVPRVARDLVRGWRKLALEAERKRLGEYSKR
jgi:hypothetical protein